MGDTAKVFMSGRSQAVRLPKKYRVDADEVEIARDGDTLVLRPRKRPSWSRLLKALDAFDAERFTDCFPQGRDQPTEQDRAGLDSVMP